MNNIFVSEEVNTTRQIEYDFAKVICIIEMIFVHCFEVFISDSTSNNSFIYYFLVIVIDSLFGAVVFVGSMGLGMVFGKEPTPEKFLKRGFRLLCAGYILYFLMETPLLCVSAIRGVLNLKEDLCWLIANDILQFSGLALMLFGFFKKIKCSDKTIFLISLGMSIIGSLVRLTNFNNTTINQFAGLFIGTYDSLLKEDTSPFPLFNWFIIVVANYIYAKKIRYCCDKDKYYKIVFPLSGIIVFLYMLYAIPNRANRIGLLSDNIIYYYQFTTFDFPILFIGTIFKISLCYFLAKLFSTKFKNIIIRISSNLTITYFAQWIIIEQIYTVLSTIGCENLSIVTTSIIAFIICIVAIILGEVCPKCIKKLL